MASIVVAYEKNYGIGAENDLLWLRELPDDLKHFKQTTMGGAVIMGRKTFDSIGKALSGRQNIVISRQPTNIEGATVVNNLDDAYAAVEPGKAAFVIGGGEIYRLAFSSVDTIYATEVQETFPQATVFFPKIDQAVWKEIAREQHKADERNAYDFDFVTYQRS